MDTAPLLGDIGAAESASLNVGAAEPLSYPAHPWRWLILFTFSLMGAIQGMVWVIPGCLAANFQHVYGLDEGMVQLLTNYGCIGFILVAWPSMWAIDRFGCRVPILACVWLMLFSNLFRVLANDASLASLVLVHAACVLDALAGPVAMAAATKLAEDWFPPRERTTATAIGALANQSGTVVVYALVPLLAPTPSAAGMRALNLFTLGLSVANAAVGHAFFPARPPAPPSASAALVVQQVARAPLTNAALLRAWAAFFCVPAYTSVVIAYGALCGLSNPQGALLAPNLALLGADQGAAGWVGAAANLASITVGVAAAAVTDALKGRRGLFKAALVGSTGAATACFALYAGCFALGAPLWLAAAAFVGANACMGAVIPLMFDISAEHCFGKGPDGAMLMGIVLPMNVVSLGALFAPASSLFFWINYGVAGVGVASTALLLAAIPTDTPRTDFDLQVRTSTKEAAAAPGAVS